MSSDSAEGSLYKFISGQEIRLLRIEGTCLTPAIGRHPDLAIVCSLRTVLLADVRDGRTPYTALSYVWGKATPVRYIVCNGRLKPVTPNVYDLLWQLAMREYDIPELIWVDAICINQDDESEKSVQVGLMRHIYSKATIVLVWLGLESASKSSELHRFWEAITHEILGPEEQDGSRVSPWTMPNVDAALKAGKDYLRQNTWFSRIWTFQEIVLATKPFVLYDGNLIPWERLAREIGPAVHVIVMIELTRSRVRQSPDDASSMTLLALLAATGTREATDSRDNLFAVLGLYHGNTSSLVNYEFPDWRVRAMASELLSAETLALVLDGGHVIWMLRGSRHPDAPDSDLGHFALFSWIPRWSILRTLKHQLNVDGWSEGGWPKAESNLHPTFKPHSTRLGDRLIVNGVLLCQVYMRLHSSSSRVPEQCPFPPCIAESKGLTLDGNVLTHGKPWGEDGDSPTRFEATWICRMMHQHRHLLCDCQQNAEAGTRNLPEGVFENGWLCKIFGTGRAMTLRPLYERITNNVVFAIIHDGAGHCIPYSSVERIEDIKSEHLFAPMQFELLGDNSEFEVSSLEKVYEACSSSTSKDGGSRPQERVGDGRVGAQ